MNDSVSYTGTLKDLLEPQTFNHYKKGKIEIQFFLLDVHGPRAKNLFCGASEHVGDKIKSIPIGTDIRVHVNIESRLSKTDTWYTNVNAWKIEVL